jgi:1,2-diacylglycerol 3-alpha-glucosyltransferase
MNIVMFTDTFQPNKNGVVSAILLEKKGLEKQGHNVYIVTVGKKEEDDDETILRIRSLPVFGSGGTNQHFRFGLFERARVNKFLKDKNIDVVHTQTEFPLGWLGYYYSHRNKLPMIHSYHTLWADYKNVFFVTRAIVPAPLVAKLFQTFLVKPDLIITPTEKSRQYLQKVVNDVPIELLQNGIPFTPLVGVDINEIRKQMGIPGNGIVALIAARLGDEKRVLQLYRVYKLAMQHTSNLYLIIAGDGARLPDIKTMIVRDGLENRILCTGFVSLTEIAKYNAIADITTTTSLSETSNMSVLEGVCSGLTVVVRNDPCFNGVLENGINGFICQDELEMVERLLELSQNPKLLTVFRKNNLAIAKQFSASHHVRKLLKLYKQVIELAN